MDFSHGFVNYASSDEEDYYEVDDEAAGTGIQSVAGAEDRSEELRQQAAQKRSERGSAKAKTTSRKLNTNVVSVELGSLISEANHVATGDPYYCMNENCRTILSAKDTLLTEDPRGEVEVADGQHLWICRFCEHSNVIEIDEAEKPVGKSQDYILERPQMAEGKMEEPLVVFCVDISGSMGSRCKVPDGEKPPSHGTLPTRLQAVQSTIADQCQALAQNNPNTRVAMVAFNSTVTIHGDGSTGRQQNIAGDALQSKALCTQFGIDYVVNMSVSDSQEQLTAALFSLKQGGQTALGPALVTSIALAGQRHGSSVIVCTDGCANVGMGSLSGTSDDASTEWYQTIGEWALERGVVVNIVSISDDGCRLELLGNVCDLSEGMVTLVNPLELTRDFSDMVQRAPIATLVTARMFVHPGLKFLSDKDSLEQNSQLASVATIPEDEEKDLENAPPKHTANFTQDVGNAFEEHKIYFEYAVKRETLEQYKELGELPFQVQIHYTRLDGARMLRVETEVKPITTNREDVRLSMQTHVMSSHSAEKTSRLAKRGDYEAARANTFLTGAWLSTNSRTEEQSAETNRYLTRSSEFDGMMQRQQHVESRDGLRAADMSENERRSARSSRRNDKMAVTMRNFSRAE